MKTGRTSMTSGLCSVWKEYFGQLFRLQLMGEKPSQQIRIALFSGSHLENDIR